MNYESDNNINDDLEDSDEIENYQVNDNVRFEQENIDISEDVMERDINDDDIDVIDEIDGQNDHVNEDNNEYIELIDDDAVDDHGLEDQEDETDVRRSSRINKGRGGEEYIPSFGGKTYEIERNVQNSMVKNMNKIDQSEIYDKLRHIACTQMQAKVGIKKHGEKAISAMFKELKQLDQGAVPELNNRVVCPIDPSTLTDEEKRKALYAVNVIKEKEMEP